MAVSKVRARGFDSEARPKGSQGKGQFVVFPTAEEGRNVRTVLQEEILYIDSEADRSITKFIQGLVHQDMP